MTGIHYRLCRSAYQRKSRRKAGLRSGIITNMKSVAVPVTNLFGSEEYVKVKKSDWNKMLDAFSKAVSRNHLLEKYEKKISNLEKKIAALTEQVEKLKRFVASRGLGEAFVEFIKLLAPKTMKQKLEDAKLDAVEHNRQRKISRHCLKRINSGNRKCRFYRKRGTENEHNL